MDTLSNVATLLGEGETITLDLPPASLPARNDVQTGVSTNYGLSGTNNDVMVNKENAAHWYALRTTYGREKKAYDYIVSKGGVAFYPTCTATKILNGRRKQVEESLIPNTLFAYGSEEVLRSFVYDNVHMPFLRFYYQYVHVGKIKQKTPLIVPDYQMSSFKIICNAETDNTLISTDKILKFQSGQNVRVIAGKFKGVEGIVARYKGQQRVGIVIDGLLTVATAYIPNAFIEPICCNENSSHLENSYV